MQLETLTVHHLGDTQDEDRRITISPANVNIIAAEVEDVLVQGRSVRRVAVLMADGGSVDVTINHADLEMLERAIGSFCLG
jgi:hypothetical protein